MTLTNASVQYVWGKIQFDFEIGTAEIMQLADWDTMKTKVFARMAIQYIQSLPEARMLKSVVLPFELEPSEKWVATVKENKAWASANQHSITLHQADFQKEGERITAAVYQYQVDNDGEWGEIRFDFVSGTAEIVKLADWDTIKSNVCAKAVIQYVQRCSGTVLPQTFDLLVPWT